MAQLNDVLTTIARRRDLKLTGRWTDTTLAGQIQQHAQRTPDKVAVVDLGGARRRTYSQLALDVASMAADLQRRGVTAGDVVAVQLPNWYDTVVIDIAVLCVGAVLNPMLPIYRTREVSYMLRTAGTRLIVTPEMYRDFDHRELIDAIRPSLPQLEHHVTVSTPTAEEFRTSAPSAVSLPTQDASAVSELMFTSGTEAEPKAIMHTEQTTNFGVRVVWDALGMNERDIVWMPSPIGHSTGLNYGVRMALYHGVTLVLQDRWSAQDALDLVANERCTYTVASTTFLSDFVTALENNPRDISSLRLFSSGGAPVSPSLVDRAEACGLPVLRLYGSTEVLIATWHRRDAPLEKRRSTDGPAMTGVEIEVRGSGHSPMVGSPGEIFVRSPSTCVGYFNDEDRTAATFDAAGWVSTGDIGVLDDEGYLTIVGRRKELIIRGGLNVAPREVEDLIIAHHKVAAAAVVGLPDDRLGEIGCACIVLKDAGDTLTLEELTAFLRSQGLSAFKLPERLELLTHLPTTPTGKVQKHELLRAIVG